MRRLSIRPRYRSLFLELTTVLCAVVAVAFAVNAWLTIVAGNRRLRDLIEGNLNLSAAEVLKRIERHLDECANELDYWSRLETLDDVMLGDPRMRVTNLLMSLQRGNRRLFEELNVIDESGAVVASTAHGSFGRTIDLAALELRPEPSGRLLLGEFPNIDELQGRDLLMVHPIISRLAPHPIGWIVARASWRSVERLVSVPESGERSEGVESFLLLLDDEGHALAATAGLFEGLEDAPNLLARLKGTAERVDLPTRFGEYLITYHRSQSPPGSAASHLRLVALWKHDQAYSVMNAFAWAVLGSAVLGLLLATGASFGIARMITGRIRRMTRGTARLATGDLDHRVEEGRADELGELARSFNNMAGRLKLARNEIESAGARWEALVRHAPDLILSLSLEGRIEFINRAASGFNKEAVIGASAYEFMPERYWGTFRQAFQDVRTTHEARGLQIETFRADGSAAWYSLRIGPVLHNGEAVGFTVIATEITEQKQLERDILEVSEKERERIGQDLHDGVGQVLTGIALLNKGLQQKLASSSPPVAAEAAQIGSLIADAMNQTRGLAEGLMPIGLDRYGLQGVLEAFAARVDVLYGVNCTFDGEPIQVERARARHLFRIAQEAVNNALKHAGARSIRIRIENRQGGGVLTVADDGTGIQIGIDTGSQPGHGMGLRLMEYRASMIGGTLEIRRGERGGTVVDCRF